MRKTKSLLYLLFVWILLSVASYNCAPLGHFAVDNKEGSTSTAATVAPVVDLGAARPQVRFLSSQNISTTPSQVITLSLNFDSAPMNENNQILIRFIDKSGKEYPNLNGDFYPEPSTSQWNGSINLKRTVVVPYEMPLGIYDIRIAMSGNVGSSTYRYILDKEDGVSEDNEHRYTVGKLTIQSSLPPQPPAPPPTTTPPVVLPPAAVGPLGLNPAEWLLTFSDEFNSTSLDTTKWNDRVWYGDENADGTLNYQVSAGSLKIWPMLNRSGIFFNRTIDTDRKFSQTYGFFEARLKVPIGRGCFPAFWLFGVQHGVPWEEIDIMEAYPGGGPSSGWSTADLHPIRFGATYHHGPNQSSLTSLGPYKNPSPVDLSAAYHTYGVDWNPATINFYFDGAILAQVPNKTNTPMYVMFDLWFGSASGKPNIAETPRGVSNSLDIDYVRVWKRK